MYGNVHAFCQFLDRHSCEKQWADASPFVMLIWSGCWVNLLLDYKRYLLSKSFWEGFSSTPLEWCCGCFVLGCCGSPGVPFTAGFVAWNLRLSLKILKIKSKYRVTTLKVHFHILEKPFWLHTFLSARFLDRTLFRAF